MGVPDLLSTSERSRDNDDSSSDAGSSSVGSQSTDELSEVLSQADMWLGRAELLQSLLGSGIAVSLDDIADKESSARLRDRLISEERYSMAVYTCKKCKVISYLKVVVIAASIFFNCSDLWIFVLPRLMFSQYGMPGAML